VVVEEVEANAEVEIYWGSDSVSLFVVHYDFLALLCLCSLNLYFCS
jgi:hypothetical protein